MYAGMPTGNNIHCGDGTNDDCLFTMKKQIKSIISYFCYTIYTFGLSCCY